ILGRTGSLILSGFFRLSAFLDEGHPGHRDGDRRQQEDRGKEREDRQDQHLRPAISMKTEPPVAFRRAARLPSTEQFARGLRYRADCAAPDARALRNPPGPGHPPRPDWSAASPRAG